MKKIFFLIGDLRGGGAQRAVVEVLKTMDFRKFSLTLVLNSLEGPYLKEVPEHVKVLVLPKSPGIWQIFRRTRVLVKFLNKAQPDIIISSLTETNIYLLQAKPFVKPPMCFVITEQNNLSRNLRLLYAPLRRWYKKIQVKLTYALADSIIAVSGGVKEDLVENYGVNTDKVIVIENPVNINDVKARAGQATPLPCGFDKSKKLLISVGRLAPQKGYFDMLEVFARIRQRISSKLIILGEGPLRKSLENKCRELALEEDVCMPGFVDNPWSQIQQADVYLSTSHWEGFSLSYIEAMACDVPLVVTDCDFGPRELIENGTNGLLAPVGHIDEIATTVIDLLQNKSLQNKLIIGGNKSAVQFDSKVIAHKYESLCEALIAGKQKDR